MLYIRNGQKSKLLWILLGCSLMLMTAKSQAEPTLNPAQKIASILLSRQCQSQLEESRIWQVAAMMISETKQIELKDKVCRCVARKTSQQLKFSDTISIIDPARRRQKLDNISVNTITACIQQGMHE